MPNQFNQGDHEDASRDRLRDMLPLSVQPTTTSVIFFAAGTPKGQPCPRAFAFHGRARMYDPGTAEHWKAAVAAAATEAGCRLGLTCPVCVEIVCQFMRPKSHFGKHDMKDSAPEYHAQKPDLDNLAKAILDALTQIGVWRDDSQVIELTVRKVWVSDPLKQGAHIAIERVPEDEPRRTH